MLGSFFSLLHFYGDQNFCIGVKACIQENFIVISNWSENGNGFATFLYRQCFQDALQGEYRLKKSGRTCKCKY